MKVHLSLKIIFSILAVFLLAITVISIFAFGYMKDNLYKNEQRCLAESLDLKSEIMKMYLKEYRTDLTIIGSSEAMKNFLSAAENKKPVAEFNAAKQRIEKRIHNVL
ncbi:MAG: hypothetical protein WC071_04250, partial [Victivallaceae bacterium]